MASSWDKAIRNQFFEAIRDNDFQKLSTFLETNGKFDVNVKDEDGSSGLHLCAGNLPCVKLLLSHGARVSDIDAEGLSPLHVAAKGDFAETLLQLIVHWADINKSSVNGSTSSATPITSQSVTPIECAVNEESRTCIDFLLFCGAKIPANAAIDQTTKNKHEVILQGYEEGNILFGGKTVGKGPAGIDIMDNKGHLVGIRLSNVEEEVDFFCRRIMVDYQNSGHHSPQVLCGDGEELISDIYQYIVDKEVTCDIRVPVFLPPTSSHHHSESHIIAVQILHLDSSAREICENINITSIKNEPHAKIKGMKLFAHGSSPIISFGVIRKIKKDILTIDHTKKQAFKSTVKPEFCVTVPAGGMKGATDLALQVLPIIDTSSISASDSGVDSCSDFCSVTSLNSMDSGVQSSSSGETAGFASNSSSNLERDSSNENINIDLPFPLETATTEGMEMAVLRCDQGNNGDDVSHWEFVKDKKITKKNGVAKVSGVGCGNFIVLFIKKVGYMVKQAVRDLYETAKGKVASCVFLAMVKPIHQYKYIVNIVLCGDQETEDRINKLRKSGFFPQTIGPSEKIMIKTKTIYMLKFLSDEGKVVDGPDSLPIQYQAGCQKSQPFHIKFHEGNTSPSGSIMVFKRKVPTKKENYGKKTKVKLSVLFETSEIPDERDSFPSDRFICSVAEEMGKHWFAVGIFLDIGINLLSTLDNQRVLERGKWILNRWRQKYDSNMIKSLEKIFQSFKEAEHLTLRRMFVDEVNRNETNGSVLRFIRENQPLFNKIPPIIVSPFGDPFVYKVATIISPKFEVLINIGVPDSRIREAQLSQDFQRTFCELLVVQRGKYDEHPNLSLLTNVVKSLKEMKYFHMVHQIKNLVQEWLKHGETGNHTKEIPRLKNIFKIKN